MFVEGAVCAGGVLTIYIPTPSSVTDGVLKRRQIANAPLRITILYTHEAYNMGRYVYVVVKMLLRNDRPEFLLSRTLRPFCTVCAPAKSGVGVILWPGLADCTI